jgi:hypothetical protein
MRFCSLEEAYPGVLLGGDVTEESGRKFYEGEAGTPVVASQLRKGFEFTDTKFDIAEKNAFVVPQQEALYAASNVKEGAVIATTSKPGMKIESFTADSPAPIPGQTLGHRCGPNFSQRGVTTGHRCGPYFEHYNNCGSCQNDMREHFGSIDRLSENNNLVMMILIGALIWMLLRRT